MLLTAKAAWQVGKGSVSCRMRSDGKIIIQDIPAADKFVFAYRDDEKIRKFGRDRPSRKIVESGCQKRSAPNCGRSSSTCVER